MDLKKIKKTFVRQHDASDCGVACLLSLLKYYGGTNTLDNLRRASGTSKTGTTLLGLYQCADNIGLEALGAEGSLHDLLKENKEAILHIKTEEGLQHYVVFYGKNPKGYIIGDPAEGVVSYSEERLLKSWESKKCLLIGKKEAFITTKTSRKYKRKWFLKLLKPDEQVLRFSIFLGVIIAVLSMALSVFSQKLVDDILPSKEIVKLIGGIGLLGLILLVRVGLSGLREYFLTFQARAFNIRIIDTFYTALLHLPKPFFDTRKIGELVARLNDTSRIQGVIRIVVGGAIIDGLVTIISLAFIFFYHWQTGVLSLVVLPVYFFLIYRFNKKIIDSQRSIMKAYALNESNYIATMQGVTAIKNYTQESFFARLNQNVYGFFQNEIFQLGKINIRLGIYSGIASVLFIVTVTGYTSYAVLQEQLELGALIAVLGIVGSVLPSVTNLALLAIPINEAKIAFDRMFEFTSIPKESNKGQKIKKIQSISIKNGAFRFIGRKPLFEGINLEIKRGEILGVVGDSGSGKTTLGYVLQKHYALESGNILVNGNTSLKDIKTASWRKKTGVVTQAPALFNGSLIENITLGRATHPEEVEKFVKNYGFDRYFLEFPGGYATPLGEEGINISGGQVQLVAFARALFSEPRFLILDEFTSAMDAEMEHFVLELLHNLKHKTLILLITHKKEQLKKVADKIFEFSSKEQPKTSS